MENLLSSKTYTEAKNYLGAQYKNGKLSQEMYNYFMDYIEKHTKPAAPGTIGAKW